MNKLKLTHILPGLIFFFTLGQHSFAQQQQFVPDLRVSDNQRYLEYVNGEPFFWLGGTPWGMSEWLNRQDVDIYLDHRKKQGFNLVQICLFWGKREDDPLNFTVNPPNAYGHKAFIEQDGKPMASRPDIKAGGSINSPNDYWDHVDYIIQAMEERGMFAAIMPVWGRRYVNAAHQGYSLSIFTEADMKAYGQFLGERYQNKSHIIWVMGGDVKAHVGGDFLGHYRAMAEGIALGVSGQEVSWNEASAVWDQLLMTYHPDGDPKVNSSQWFHQDAWLDFNMIETFTKVNALYDAVQHDYLLANPVKPTVMGEPGYEGFPISGTEEVISALQIRRQAYQSMFAGAAGFTYGGFRDENNNGPLFSPYKGWKKLLDMEGANAMKYMKAFCLEHQWPHWTPLQGLIIQHRGEGEFRKVAVLNESNQEIYMYFPDASTASLGLADHFEANDQLVLQWFETKSGRYSEKKTMTFTQGGLEVQPPEDWEDAVLMISQP